MRIVIDTEGPDEGQAPATTATSKSAPVVFDGGPAPAALLRRFGRIPDALEPVKTMGGREPSEDSEGGEMVQNPLRLGESMARQRQREDRERAVDEGEPSEVKPADGPTPFAQPKED